MRLLDEATAAAVAGEMTDPDAIVTTCCYLISACERVRDYDRAAQWCERAIRLADRWSYRFMFAYCRSHYAGVLIWRGAWPEAEAELEAATGELATTFPAMAAEGIARLAELRRRQGRIEEAHALLDRLDAQPLRALGSKLALLGRAALALDRGDPTAAVALAERFLRGVPAGDRVERIDGLELLARAQAALGDHAQAARTMAELQAITAAIATPSLQAVASHVEGVVAAAARTTTKPDVGSRTRSTSSTQAGRHTRRRARAWSSPARSLPSTARCRRREAQVALTILEQIGAVRRPAGSGAVRHLESPRQSAAGMRRYRRLTPRELEILVSWHRGSVTKKSRHRSVSANTRYTGMSPTS